MLHLEMNESYMKTVWRTSWCTCLPTVVLVQAPAEEAFFKKWVTQPVMFLNVLKIVGGGGGASKSDLVILPHHDSMDVTA